MKMKEKRGSRASALFWLGALGFGYTGDWLSLGGEGSQCERQTTQGFLEIG